MVLYIYIYIYIFFLLLFCLSIYYYYFCNMQLLSFLFFLSSLAIVYNCICIDVFCRFITYVNKSSNCKKYCWIVRRTTVLNIYTVKRLPEFTFPNSSSCRVHQSDPSLYHCILFLNKSDGEHVCCNSMHSRRWSTVWSASLQSQVVS